MKNLFVIILLTLMISCRNIENNNNSKIAPNIIFIISDDHAYQAISAYDKSLIETPNIDRLAKEGMLFNRAFVTNSICSPSRAVTLTGKFSHINGVRDNVDVFDSSQVTFPKLLQIAGYETAIYGKWHLKSKPTGFNHWAVLPDQGEYYHPEFITPTRIIQEQGYVTDVITDKAINYLENLRAKDKPFMLMYNHKAPHRHWWPSIEDLEYFKDKKFPVTETLFDEYKTKSKASVEAEMRIGEHMALTADNKIAPEILKRLGYKEFLDWYIEDYIYLFDRLTPEEQQQWQKVYGPINQEFLKNSPKGQALTLWKYQRYLEDYLGVIKSVDKNIGRLLDYLDSNNLTENTIVVYTSDQGFFLGEHGWFDKRFMYEQSFRTPLLIRYPNVIKPNSVNSDLVQNIDFAPTMLEIAGLDVPIEMQGQSLVPLFHSDNSNWRDAIYYNYYEYPGIHMVKRHYGIRTDRFKLIHFYYDIDEWEMYDLEKDPDEMNNIYSDPQYDTVKTKLHKRLEELRIKYHDSDSLNAKWIQHDIQRE